MEALLVAKLPRRTWIHAAHEQKPDRTHFETYSPRVTLDCGADGPPSTKDAGNARRSFTALKPSPRVPPTVDGAEATAEVKRRSERDTPSNEQGASVVGGATGWNAPAFAPWRTVALDAASMHYFGRRAAYMGEGGTILIVGMLGAKFPDAQMLVTSALGPKSNAYEPNEFLHIDYAKKVTASTVLVISAV